MRTRSHRNERVALITLGCSKNTVDSEVLMSQLHAGQVDARHEHRQDADTVIINTCGFIENAKQESIDTILQYAESKRAGTISKLLVTGCLSQRYRDELQAEIPEVDAWFGTMDMPHLLNNMGVDYRRELLGERKSSVAKHYAYLKISEGCDRPCSFCAIPLMRGKHVSRPIEELVAEAKGLVRDGVRELMLIAQDSTYYGIDLYGKRSLDQLLDRLSDIEGLDWIRLHYAYPSKFPFEILPIMAAKPNICKYLDIPIQHISDPVLKSMRRGVTRRRTVEILDRIREEVPGIALRTTLLVGHPGEYEAEFEELHQFIQDYKFHRLGVFTYSHEDGTHAYGLEDHVPEEEKERRAQLIMDSQYDIALALNRELIGTTQRILIDRLEGDHFIGRTQYDSPDVDNEVVLPVGDGYLRIGDFISARIEHAEAFDLHARRLP